MISLYASQLRHDVKIGVRMLVASPGFTVVALLSLTLGICVSTCAYSEVNGMLRDLPGVAAPEQLIALQKPVAFPAYRRFRELHDLFSDSAAYIAPVPLAVSFGGHNERYWGQVVSPSYFRTLAVRPLLGRFFDDDHEQPGQPAVAVVSHRFWHDRLGSDPLAVGRTIRVNGQPCTVVGVGGQDFLGASPALFPADLWLPATVDARTVPELGNNALEHWDLTMFQMVARLRPEKTEIQAQAEMTAAASQMAEAAGIAVWDRKDQQVAIVSGGKVLPLRKQDVPFMKEFLLVLGGLLLVIACANTTNMMLARAADRRREIAMRLALGATRARLIRQLLTETLLLAVCAAPPAFLLCLWVMRLLSHLRMPLPIPVSIDLQPDWHALLFAVALTGVTALGCGLAPALQATRTDLISALKDGVAIRLRRYRALSLRNMLMFSQVAASLMLLLMTGYLGLGIQSTLGLQEGFDPNNVYLISIDPVRDGFRPDEAARFFDRLLDRVTGSPGVAAACVTDTLPASTDGNAGVLFLDSSARQGNRSEALWARKHTVGRRYFETAGIRILSGREFDKHDETAGATPVIVSNEAVRRFWNGQDPVGRRIELTNSDVSGNTGLWPGSFDFRNAALSKAVRTFEVVGVAADVSEDLVASKRHPAIYFPLRPADYAQPSVRGVTIMLRATPGADAIAIVQREIAGLDSRIAPFNGRTMIDHIGQFMSMLKAASWTYGLMGLSGLVLASIGLAGVTAYSVAKRRHEIGIRMALGAQKSQVLRLVMKEGATLVALGSAAGVLLALAGIRALSGVFFTVATVRTYDPVLLGGAPLLLACVALVACYLPARRSTSIDPATSLRTE